MKLKEKQKTAILTLQRSRYFLRKLSLLSPSISQKYVKLFIAEAIIRDITKWKTIESIEVSYFNKINFMQDIELIALLMPLLCPKLYEDLYAIVKLSSKSNSISLAAANAISLLNKSNFEFKNLDLRGINISGADLSKGQFINVNFKGSCLKNVNFCHSKLHNFNFRNCDLTGALFSSYQSYQTIGKFENPIKKLVISKNGEFLLICTTKNTILWEINSKTQLHSFNIISKSAAFSPCENLIALVDDKRKWLIKWDRKSVIMTENAYNQKSRYEKIYGLSFSPCGKYILLWGRGFIDLNDSISFNVYKKWRAYQWGNLNFTKCGKYIIFSDEGWIKQISVESGNIDKLVRIIGMGSEQYLSPSYKYLSVNGSSLFIINVETRESIFAKDLSGKNFTPATSWSPNEDKIAFLTENGFGLFDIEKQEIVAQIRENCSKYDSICYSKCGKYLFIGTSNGLLKLWNLESISYKN